MKKAKIILTAIAVFAVIGGALAFKTSKFTPFQAWTLNGTILTSTTLTTTVGGPVLTYTAVVPNCVLTNRFFTDNGLVLGEGKIAVDKTVRATVIGGPITATTFIPYFGCDPITTFITLQQ